MKSLRPRPLFILLPLLILSSWSPAEEPNHAPAGWSDLRPDTWAATDGLGRVLSDHEVCGAPRDDRFVGIFYFLWLGQHGTQGPFDITEITEGDPPRPAWGPRGRFHHWGESELGYYLSDDEYVIRKHACQLTNAGVDVLFFDVTNGFAYDKCFLRLCDVYRQMRSQGLRTPQIAFLTNSSSERVVAHLYEAFYLKGLFRELWFVWDGKPLILSKTDGLTDEIREFFTFRQSWAWTRTPRSDPTPWFGDGQDRWPWLDHYPQRPGWHLPGVAEQIAVAVAQHPVSNIGRSFHDGRQPVPGEVRTDWGLCFAEQWERALEVDPQLVFITGWNEWVAQRFIAERSRPFLGGQIDKGDTYFVDQYNREFSRDIEPMRGGHGDAYYYQMIDGIRRFKGVRPVPTASGEKTVAIDGRFDDWDEVRPEYRDAPWDTTHRDHPGWGQAGHYRDTSGRNDLVRMKVARDRTTLFFMAQAREPITAHTDPDWMLLLLDVDEDWTTGWQGYDFVVNASVLGPGRTTLARLDSEGRREIVAELDYAVRGRRLELAIPRKLLNWEGGLVRRLQFHWADNTGSEAGPAVLAERGENAPDRRFNYVYRVAP